jgi:hypothetical protein
MKYPVIVFAALCVIIGCKSNPAVEPDNNNNTPPTPLGTYTIAKAFPALPVLDNPVELTAPGRWNKPDLCSVTKRRDQRVY